MKTVHIVSCSLAAGLLIVGTYTVATSQTARSQTTKVLPASPNSIHLEAEAAQLQGPSLMTKRAGYRGAGYVSGFTKEGDKITWTIPDAKAGLYEARIRYSSPGQPKGYDLSVNGSKTSAMFAPTSEGFRIAKAGKIELRDGENTIALEKGWGYYDVDAIDLMPAAVNTSLKPVPAALVDPKASPATKALMKSLLATYGKKTLSGQYDFKDNEYIRTVTGKLPAIRGGDLMDYSPSRLEHGADPKKNVEELIQGARNGQIITLSWHWNAPSGLYNGTYTNASGKRVEAPWWRGFYTDASKFDLAKAMSNPNSSDYKLLVRDMDAIAVQLKKFSAAGVPILWRPLHEAEGGWFWWGAKGPEPFKKLWQLMFNRLTQVHQLHNLIWVYTAGSKMDWYPGDKYVDIVGVDAYPSDSADPLSQTWDDLKAQFDGRKLMAITEFGKVPDIPKMHRYGGRWAYFVSWTGNLGPEGVNKADLPRLYNNAFVLNRSDLKLTTQTSMLVTPPVAEKKR